MKFEYWFVNYWKVALKKELYVAREFYLFKICASFWDIDMTTMKMSDQLLIACVILNFGFQIKFTWNKK